ncbi:MAG: phage minor head protein [Weissella confusa]
MNIPVIPHTRYPQTIEEWYSDKLHDMVQGISRLVVPIVEKYWPDEHLVIDSAFSFDSLGDDMAEFETKAQQVYGDAPAQRVADLMLKQINNYSTNIIQAQVAAHVGAPLPGPTPHNMTGFGPTDEEQAFLKQHISENVRYIKALGDDQVKAVSQAVYDGMTKGMKGADVADNIMKATSISYNRAKTIARSETGSAFGRLNKMKSQKAGIHHFRWQTMEDDRVRDSHKHLDRKLFNWDDGWNGVFPGDPINCRCVATAVFDDEFDDADPDDIWEPDDDGIDVSDEINYIGINQKLSSSLLSGVSLNHVNKKTLNLINVRMEEYTQNNTSQVDVTADQKNSVITYTGKSYIAINSYLRGDMTLEQANNHPKYESSLSVEQNVENIDDAISKSENKKPLMLVRRVKDDELASFENYMESNTTYDAYTSTSAKITPYTAKRIGFGNNQIVFHVPSGKGYGIFINKESDYPNQVEYLLKRNLRFKVVDRKMNQEGAVILTVEVVDDDSNK